MKKLFFLLFWICFFSLFLQFSFSTPLYAVDWEREAPKEPVPPKPKQQKDKKDPPKSCQPNQTEKKK